MKRQPLTALFCAVFLTQMAPSAPAQGRITFFNNNITNPNTGAIYRAGIFRTYEDYSGNGPIGAGAGYTAGLFLASDLNTPLATASFRTTSAQEVFATALDIQVPGVPPGQSADLVVRVWSTAAGSYRAALSTLGAQYGQQAFTSKPLGGGDTPTPDMAPFTGFVMNGILNPVGVVNGSFNLPSPAAGFVMIGAPTSWSTYNPQNINGTSDLVGVLNPTGTGHFLSNTSDGSVALVLMNGPSTSEAGLDGIVSLTVGPERRYTLMVSIGNPASGASRLGSLNLNGFPGYRVELRADTAVLASDDNTLAAQIPEGEFRSSKIVFTTGASHPAMHQIVRVRLVNLNQPGTTESPGAAVAFDNVRVVVEPIQPTIQTQSAGLALVAISWIDFSDLFQLETAATVNASPAEWLKINSSPANEFGNHSVQVPTTTNAAFYRLRIAN